MILTVLIAAPSLMLSPWSLLLLLPVLAWPLVAARVSVRRVVAALLVAMVLCGTAVYAGEQTTNVIIKCERYIFCW